MFARLVIVTAMASLVLLLGAPKNTLACHKGDPGVPHGAQTTCDGDGVPTTFVLKDVSGNVVGPASSWRRFPVSSI